jgi:uncharacterized membrane protein
VLEYAFYILLAVAWAIGTPVVAIVALARTAGLRGEIDQLRRLNERLAQEVARLRQPEEQGVPEALPPPFVPSLGREPPLPVPEPVEPVEPVEAPPPPAEEAAPPPPPLPPAPIPPPAPPWPPVPQPASVGWEQRLGARAFIWIGAVTLALAAVFLVRYSIEEGYLSPPVRVILAAVFGFVLIGFAERLRSRDDRVAQALAAAGVAALYGALFAAVALYDMISKPAAGIGAAALTAFAIGVSLRHGIFVAGLAFVGGFASPAIIGSQTPNTPVLFGYLLAIAAGTLAVIRYRGWWPLGWGVLAGSAIWTLVWMWSLAGGLAWVGLFLVAVAVLFVWAAWQRVGEPGAPVDDVLGLVWLALALTGALIVGLIVQDKGVQSAGWLALVAHGAGLYVLARWRPRLQFVAVLAPVLSLAALFLWSQAAVLRGGFDSERFEGMAALLGGLYAVGAFAMLWNAARPGFWAALAVGAAFAHFLLAWYVLRGIAGDMPWGLVSIGLAVPFLIGAERLSRWRGAMAGATEALGIMAAGVTLFVAFAIAVELRREWITVAYAAEFAAVAAIAAMLGLEAMRKLCWPLLAVVVVRFVLNPAVLSYPLGVTPIFNWILWGYGLAIAALAAGWRVLRPTGDVRLVRATEAAIALLIFVLLTLEVRSLFQPDAMRAFATGFMERAFYALVWGGFALAALWLARTQRDPVTLWAWRVAGALAIGLVLVMQVVVASPLRTPPSVGELPIVNGLLLAYAVPAAMAALAYRWVEGVETDRRVALFIGGAAAFLAFAWMSLEVRHFFDPGFQRQGFGKTGFMERSFYVLVWGAFALAALWLARTWRDPVVLWTWRVVGVLAAALALVVQVVIANPVFDKADVGSLPLANGLFLAYALPAAMAALARRWIDVEPERNVVVVVEATASILAFAWVSMEVRHFFDPSFARRGLGASGLELYVYSAIWLLFGVALLALGFLRSAPALRHAGMALVCVVVAKVFLIDMAGLQGLLRVFSFLGLGAALIGLGYAYRRFGFR